MAKKQVTAKSKSKKPVATQPAKDAGIDRIKRLIRSQGEELLKRPNVTSVAIGIKKTGGRSTGEPCLQFSVEQKFVPESLAAEGIPPLPEVIEFEGVRIPTDIVERKYEPSYKIVALENKSDRKVRQDPVRGGISVGHISVTAGTLGAIVRDVLSGEALILSNWHVLSGHAGKPGDTIVQPGRFDDDRVALNKLGVLRRSHLGIAGDCAVASIENRKFDTELLELGTRIESVGKAELGDLVVKSGRTTGVTYGLVSRIEGLFKIEYEGAGVQAVSGFEIEPSPDHPAPDDEISKGGDSGAAWMATDPASGLAAPTMLGLHFGGDAEGVEGEFSLACYAHNVFQKLEIEPYVTAQQVEAARAPKAAINALRTGFDAGFLSFDVPRPAFLNRVAKDLKGLDGTDSIEYCHFSVWLSGTRKLPVCVAWNIDGGRKKSLSRKGIAFVKDERDGLDEYQLGNELYASNDLDRGHVARRDDLVWGDMPDASQANHDSFYFTNMTPQHRAFNQSMLSGKWGLLENAILDDVNLHDLRVSLMAGPILEASDTPYRGVKIPREFWKAVFYVDDDDNGAHKARAFVLTQKDLLDTMKPEVLELEEFRWYQVPLAKIEELTGIRFAKALHGLDAVAQGVGTAIRLIEGGDFFPAQA